GTMSIGTNVPVGGVSSNLAQFIQSGGRLTHTNSSIFIGPWGRFYGGGTNEVLGMDLSNGGAALYNGALKVSDSILIGTNAGFTNGVVGQIFVTNASHTARIQVRGTFRNDASFTFTREAALLEVDNLLITNNGIFGNGNFVNEGTLINTNSVMTILGTF